MIEYLKGKIFKKFMPQIILDVNGVGYGVELSLTNFASLPLEGHEIGLWIYTRVKEDVLKLYGFSTLEERKVFDILLDVNGVGPKVALSILSALTVSQLKSAVERREPEVLQSVPGIGKRTAEKIVVELQSKIEKFPYCENAQSHPSMSQNSLEHSFADVKDNKLQDLSSALENLGFKKKEFFPVIDKLVQSHAEEPFPNLMRKALALLKPLDKPRDLDALF